MVSVAVVAMMSSFFEYIFEAVFKPALFFLILLFYDLFDFEEIMLMVDCLLAILAKIKHRAGGTLVSYSDDRIFQTAFAFIALVGNNLLDNWLGVSKLLANARH
jgi:hypothetical protein